MSLDLHIDHIRLRRSANSATPSPCIVHNLYVSIAAGTVHTLMGPSGAGKSAVLSVVAGTLDPALTWQGNVFLDGQDVSALPTHQRGIGLLFQDDLLFAHMTVAQNLLFALPAGDVKSRMDEVLAALAEAGLAGFAHRDPATLSGGQRARVALLRCLLAKPKALLLDEPFSKLDASLRVQFRQWVFAQIADRGIPALLVTHDAADVADYKALTELAAVA